MYYNVRIKKLPSKATGGPKTGQQNPDGSLSIHPTPMGGADIDQYIGEPDTQVKKSLTAVPREEANLEAEGGETAYGDINGDGMLEHYNIEGPRHNAGGVPLNLPDDSFIYSDFNQMKIKDPDMLAMFGKKKLKGSSSKGYTPAQLAKQYDINKYRKLLQDPNSDNMTRKTAELMIKNYNMKLGALALAQEGVKAFPQGIPKISEPYLEANGISPEQLLPKTKIPQREENAAPTQMPNGQPIAQSEEMMQAPMAAYGMEIGGYPLPFYDSLPVNNTFQKGGAPYTEAEGYSPKGVERLNMYRRMYGLPQLKGSVTKADIQKAAGELQSKIIDSNPDLVVDYMSRTSHQPNKKLLPKIPAGYSKTTEGVRQAYEDGKLSAEDIRQAYKDDLWWYRALETNVKELSKEEYEKKMKEPGAVKQGDKLYFQEDADNPQLYTEYVMKDGEKPADTTVTDQEETQQEGERPEITNPDFAQQPYVANTEWMTPDLMNYYGAIKDRYGINKYYGWTPRFDPETFDGEYLDPTRQLASQSEQANIMAQALAQFTNPQQASARTSSIQGQGAKQAADTLSSYNNANVQIANELGMTNAGIRNQAQLQNQAATKQLYNENTFTNQNYDNSLNAADQAKRLAFNTGFKNASELGMVNTTSDQYDIDPRTGDIIFTGGKQHTPELAKDFNYWLDYYKKNYGMGDKEAIAAAKIAMGQGSGYYGPDAEAMMAGMAKKGMIITGGMTYPFIL